MPVPQHGDPNFEAAERKRDAKSWPYQSLRFLSQDVFLRPGLCLPSIFLSITSLPNRKSVWQRFRRIYFFHQLPCPIFVLQAKPTDPESISHIRPLLRSRWYIYYSNKMWKRFNTIIGEVIFQSAGTITMNQSHVNTTKITISPSDSHYSPQQIFQFIRNHFLAFYALPFPTIILRALI